MPADVQRSPLGSMIVLFLVSARGQSKIQRALTSVCLHLSPPVSQNGNQVAKNMGSISTRFLFLHLIEMTKMTSYQLMHFVRAWIFFLTNGKSQERLMQNQARKAFGLSGCAG
jgi:hypothetical protein